MGKSKEILIVTNYFPPEKGAASNRIFSMVKGFSENEYNVTVVCPLPNYPQGKVYKNYRGEIYKKTEESYGHLYRLWIWPTKSSNKFIRLLSMMSFSLSLKLFFLFKKTPKKVLIQYSPVFVGFTAVLLSKILRKKVILNISDLWPLAGLEMGLLNKGFYYNILTKMELFCYKNSQLILGQSEEILTHIRETRNKASLVLYRNYPEFNPPTIDDFKNDKSEIKIVYAGLLGVAQGLYKICNEVAFSKRVSLHIYGAGPEAEQIKSLGKPHIFYYGEMEREKLHAELENHDIGFVPLANRIYGSVPSKIFELSRLGLPVLYFAGGEGENIVKENRLGWVISVNNLNELQEFIDSLSVTVLKNFSNNEVQKSAIANFNFKEQFTTLIKIVNNI